MSDELDQQQGLSPGPAKTPAELVSEAYMLRGKVNIAKLLLKANEETLGQVEARIAALGKGKHAGLDGLQAITVVVVDSAPDAVGADTFELSPEKLEAARELAGDKFKAVFDRVVTYGPCVGFAELLPKLLSKAKAAALRALCLVPGKVSKGRAGYTQLRYS